MIKSSNFDDIFKRNISVSKAELLPLHTLDDAGKGLVGAASPVPLTVNISAGGEILYLYYWLVFTGNPTVVGQRVEMIL